MPTFSIHIAGQVQGVGVRPFVYRLAKQLNLNGWVSNRQDGVHIKVSGKNDLVQEFYHKLLQQPPPLARIFSHRITETEEENFYDFRILQEAEEGAAGTMLTPDLAMCEVCRQEICDIKNRRFGYAFTTCTNCGPRYSILRKLPYEREYTTMAPFQMCETCKQEYHDPENRRFFSQTNSCPECPVLLTLYEQDSKVISDDQQEIIEAAAAALAAGKIVAVKGTGGFLLMVDATNSETLRLLRKRKHRPAKPFALMYPNLETAREDVALKPDEEALLFSPLSPVVLVSLKQKPSSGIIPDLVAPGLQKLGIMLPYTPLFDLLLSVFGKPVVATSANSGGSPIIFRDEEAFEKLTGIADLFLTHNREILVPQDDPVVQFTPLHQQPILLRRSRGLAPSFTAPALMQPHNLPVLALGADLKATFAFSRGGNICVSQYLGDLTSFDNLLNFEQVLQHLTSLFQVQPSLILMDKHPEYASVRFGKKLAETLNVPIISVQHHEAHFAAVLAENELLKSQEPVLGVIWDGTGLGHDGLIRGGEFLQLQPDMGIRPLAQVDPFPHLLGNKMPLEPRLSALALCHSLTEAEVFLQHLFSETEWKLFRSLLAKKGSLLQTTSMGRIFDAAAALLGLCSWNSYEGEAALALETAAGKVPGILELPPYSFGVFDGINLPFLPVFGQIVKELQQGIGPEWIAARFHITLVRMIETVARHYGFIRIAFSGGVFQNALLTDLIIEKLRSDFQLFFHKDLPPNDECVSFGQLGWMQLQEQLQKHPGQKSLENKVLEANI